MKPAVVRPDLDAEFYTPERCHILEMSNTPDDPAMSIARARVEPGVTTAFHHVLATAERYVILEGSGLVELGDMEPEQVAVGDVVLIPADVTQRITNTGNNDLVFLALCTPRFEPQNYISTE